jgi:hypothetical protein
LEMGLPVSTRQFRKMFKFVETLINLIYTSLT